MPTCLATRADAVSLETTARTLTVLRDQLSIGPTNKTFVPTTGRRRKRPVYTYRRVINADG